MMHSGEAECKGQLTSLCEIVMDSLMTSTAKPMDSIVDKNEIEKYSEIKKYLVVCHVADAKTGHFFIQQMIRSNSVFVRRS